MSRRGRCYILLSITVLLAVQFAPCSGKLAIENTLKPDTAVLIRSLAFQAKVSEFEILKVGDLHYLFSDGLQFFTQPGEPLLPMKTMISEFPKGVDILRVLISHESRALIQGEFNLVPTPKPLTFGDSEIEDYWKDPEVYALDDLFPREVFSYMTGEDNHRKYLYVHFYPVQYNPKSRRISLVTELIIDVHYRLSSTGHPLADDLNSECIIITRPDLYWEAKSLSEFHEASLGVPTSVVNTTWIYANYQEAPDPPFQGYWNDSLPYRDNITGYNYSLAKRTVNFLRNQSVHPNLLYVLVYGNAELVPPSFYYNSNSRPYDGWLPTDFFYSSPDYDLTPNFAVGRLPVDDNIRAQKLNQKIVNWYSNISGEWFENVITAGGRPWRSLFYLGELMVQDVVNRGYLDGLNLTKMHITDRAFDKTRLLDALSGGYGMIYVIGHGGGDTLLVNETGLVGGELIDVAEIMNLPGGSNVSVFVSMACDNGAFDNTIMANRPFASQMSLGESLLFSPSGAIAYVGNVRLTFGRPIGILDDGELRITGEKYMSHLITSFFRAYHNDAETLGKASMDAMAHFVASDDMNDRGNVVNLFQYVFLGDPVLPLRHPHQERYQVPSMQISNTTGSAPDGMDYIIGRTPNIPSGEPNSVRVSTDSPSVRFKMIEPIPDVVLEYRWNATLNNETEYAFVAPTKNTNYLLIAEGEGGKEGWQYMRTKPVKDHPKAPVLKLAKMIGPNDEDVLISWFKSIDEGDSGGPVTYDVCRSDMIFGPYVSVHSSIPTGQPEYSFVDSGRGDLDPSNYFYYVEAVNSTGEIARSYYAAKYSLSLTRGWHLVSLPLVFDDNDTATVFRTLNYSSIVGYLSGDTVDPWKRYDSSKNYTDLNQVNHTMGLWVNVTTDDNLTVAGLLPKTTSITLNPGWNLVGYPSFLDAFVQFAFLLVDYDRIESYDPTNPPYYLRVVLPNEDMSAWNGYWIKVSTQQTWTVYNR